MNDKYSDKLEVKTKNVINELYLKILGRPADEDGFQYWGSLLESGKITKDEMRQEFLNSYEYKTFRANKTIKIKSTIDIIKFNLSNIDVLIEKIKLSHNSWKDSKSTVYKYTDYKTNVRDVINSVFTNYEFPKYDLNQLHVHFAQFIKNLESKQMYSKYRPYPIEYSIENDSGLLLYLICKILKPKKVVETGVAYGLSSSYILQALHENNQGKLFSIDYAFKPWESKHMIGSMIPENLRYRWKLIYGTSSKKLKPLLNSIKPIDIFIHDSAHTYNNMNSEYQTAWNFLRKDGLLISDDVGSNNAFYDFTNQKNLKPELFSQMNENFQKYYKEHNVKTKTFLGIVQK